MIEQSDIRVLTIHLEPREGVQIGTEALGQSMQETLEKAAEERKLFKLFEVRDYFHRGILDVHWVCLTLDPAMYESLERNLSPSIWRGDLQREFVPFSQPGYPEDDGG